MSEAAAGKRVQRRDAGMPGHRVSGAPQHPRSAQSRLFRDVHEEVRRARQPLRHRRRRAERDARGAAVRLHG